MKKILLGLACLAGFGSAQASGLAIGTDVLKLLDNNQFNIIVQSPLNNKSSLFIGASLGESSDVEISYKAYSSDMFNSVFYQFGGLVTNLGGNSDSDLGLVGKIGYEHSPALHFVFFGSVTGTYILDSNNIAYTPELGVMFSF